MFHSAQKQSTFFLIKAENLIQKPDKGLSLTPPCAQHDSGTPGLTSSFQEI